MSGESARQRSRLAGGLRGLWLGVRVVLRKTSRDRLSLYAAAMAYHLTFALVPFLIVIAAITTTADRLLHLGLAQRIIDELQVNAPGGAREFLGPEVERVLGTHPAGLFSIGLPLSLFAVSAAMATLMRALDDAYDVEERRSPFVRRLIALGLTAALSISIVAAFGLVVFGGRLSDWLSEGTGLGAVLDPAWRVARLLFAAAFVTLAFDAVYWLGPNIRHRFRFGTPGSIFATAGWLVATEGFAFYADRFGNFAATYGSIGAAIAMLLWFYITSFVILIGGEVNSLISLWRRGEAARLLRAASA